METEEDVDQYYVTIADDDVESPNRTYEGLQMDRAAEHGYEKLEADTPRTDRPQNMDMTEKASKKKEGGKRSKIGKKPLNHNKKAKRAEGVCKSPTTCSISLPWWGWLGVLLGIILLGVSVALAFFFVTRGGTSEQGTTDVSTYGTKGTTQGTTAVKRVYTYVSTPTIPTSVTSRQPTINIAAPPVTLGPLSAKPYCELRTSVRRNYAVTEPDSSYSPKFLTQSSEIDTIQKCMQQCVSRLDEDLPPSTDTCLGANFEYSTKTCRLVISPHNYMSKTGYAYIWVFYKCHQALSPGQATWFRKMNHRKPQMDTSVSHVPGSSPEDCYVKFNRGRIRRASFAFNKQKRSCIRYSRITDTVVENGSFLYIAFYGNTYVCQDAFPSLQPGIADSEGVLQTGTFQTPEDCQARCTSSYGHYTYDFTCHGFDYDSVEHSCHISLTRDSSLILRKNTMRYTAKVLCYSKGCTYRIRYISTANTGLSEGSVYDYDSAVVCATRCSSRKELLLAQPCYGFSFDKSKSKCILHHRFNHPLGVVGGMPGVYQYRRLLYCSDSCEERYTKTINAASAGGILQPRDINTFAICAARCMDYVIATDNVCHGFDLNTKTNECYVYLQPDYDLVSSEDFDNYRRVKPCPLPY